MVGPSSSHRPGRWVGLATVAGRPAAVTIELYGSFAQTYKGHSADKAIIAGLLGMTPDDERIKDGLELAPGAGNDV